MSWDTDYKRERCPCGKGYLVQEIRSNDWNQYEKGTPYIECEECKKKYKVISLYFYQPKWKDDGIAYYLIPKDFEDPNYENKYRSMCPWSFASRDFPKFLICSYSESNLKDALNELNQISNCSLADGILSEVAKDRKRYLRSCKKVDLMADLKQALEKYDDVPNFEKIEAEEHRNKIKQAAFEETVRKIGIRIF